VFWWLGTLEAGHGSGADGTHERADNACRGNFVERAVPDLARGVNFDLRRRPFGAERPSQPCFPIKPATASASAWWSATIGAACLAGFYALIHAATHRGLGLGDVATSVPIGIGIGVGWLDWRPSRSYSATAWPPPPFPSAG